MHLYIRSGEFSTEVPGISLLEGHVPAIESLTPALGEDGFPAMEPAAWFKVLILDSISIDCTRKAVHWNSLFPGLVDSISMETVAAPGNRALRRERRKRLSESMFLGGECCYGMEDVFENAQILLDDYLSSKISSGDFHQEVFALLHLHVLPNIKLNSDDAVQLKVALDKQEAIIKWVDSEIIAKSKKIEEVQTSMCQLRRSLLGTLLAESRGDDARLTYYPPALVRCLQRHIEHDIQQAWEKIEVMQDGIEMLKSTSSSDNGHSSESSSSSSDSSPSKELELNHKREEREQMLKNYEQLISAREILHALANGGSIVDNPPPKRLSGSLKKNKKSKMKSHKNAPQNPLHNIYLEMENTIQQIDEQMQLIATKKVRIRSVAEALRSALRELENYEETYGVDLDSTGSQRPTDVVRKSHIPKEWQTLTERVAVQLKKGRTITKNFEEFQHQILTQCQGLLDEQCVFETAQPMLTDVSSLTDSVDSIQTEPGLQQQGGDWRQSACFPGFGSSDKPKIEYYRAACESFVSLTQGHGSKEAEASDYMFVYDKQRDYLKAGIDYLRMQIKTHFRKIVLDLLKKVKCEDLSENSESYRKVWLCYESYFYEAVMPSLLKVYEKAFAVNMECLETVLPQLTTSDLNMENPLLLHLLQDKPNVCNSSSQSGEMNCETEIDKDINQENDSLQLTLSNEQSESDPQTLSHPKFPNIEQGQKCTANQADRQMLSHAETDVKSPQASNISGISGIRRLSPKFPKEEANARRSGMSAGLVQMWQEFDPTTMPLPTTEETGEFCSDDSAFLTDTSALSSEKICDMCNCDVSCCVCEQREADMEVSECSVLNEEVEKCPTVAALPVTDEHGAACGQQTYSASSSSIDKSDRRSSGESGQDLSSQPVLNTSLNDIRLQEAEDIVSGFKKLDFTQRGTTMRSSLENLSESAPGEDFISQVECFSATDFDQFVGRDRSVSEPTVKRSEDAEFCEMRELTEPPAPNDLATLPATPTSPPRPPSIIRIYHPTSVTTVYHRCTWPVGHHKPQLLLDDDVESGVEAIPPQPRATPPGSPNRKSVLFKPEYARKLAGATSCLTTALRETAPLLKLRELTRCLRKINQQVSALQTEFSQSGGTIGANSDDLIDMLVLLLCNHGDLLSASHGNISTQSEDSAPKTVSARLYPHIQLLTDLMPPFFDGGPYSFSLVQFSVAFTFLQERLVMQRNLEENRRARDVYNRDSDALSV